MASSLCACFSFCCGEPTSLKEQKPHVSRVRDQPRTADTNRDRDVKILLLGAGESGKSTFIKQMRIINNQPFGSNIKAEFRQAIRQNVIDGLQILLYQREKYGICWEHDESAKSAWRVLHIDKSRFAEDDIYSSSLIPDLLVLKNDEAVRETFSRRNLPDGFRISENVAYFLPVVDRIASTNYEPSDIDIIFARRPTIGIVEYRIRIESIPFLFVDVGGQRSQRAKWFQCFDSVNAILFLTACNEYDQMLSEDRSINSLTESMNIFQAVVNNMFFVNIPIILLLNKTDLLEQKIKCVPINGYYRDFQGDPESLLDVQDFILAKFRQRIRHRSKMVYHHWTSMVDTNLTKQIFKDVREEIRKQNLKSLGLF